MVHVTNSTSEVYKQVVAAQAACEAAQVAAAEKEWLTQHTTAQHAKVASARREENQKKMQEDAGEEGVGVSAPGLGVLQPTGGHG